jgi:hypothetical protein
LPPIAFKVSPIIVEKNNTTIIEKEYISNLFEKEIDLTVSFSKILKEITD